MRTLRVLGIDPGSVAAGWGLVRREGARLVLEDSGVLRPKGRELADRLHSLHGGMEAVIHRLRPDVVAVEAVFHARHARSALVLGHARGVLLLAASQARLEVFEYPPAMVKKAVTGDGRADKEAVRRMVDRLLDAEVGGPHDRSDALAVAICHAHGAGFQRKVRDAGPGGRKALPGRDAGSRPRVRLRPRLGARREETDS